MEAIPRNRTGHLHAAYKRLSVSPWNSYCKAVLENSCCAALHNHIWSTPDCRTAHVLYHDYDIVPLLANDSSFLHALTWIFWLCPLEGILETTIILQWHASTKRPTARMIFWTSGFVFRSPANSIYGTFIFPWKQVLTQRLQLYCNLCIVVHQASCFIHRGYYHTRREQFSHNVHKRQVRLVPSLPIHPDQRPPASR